MNKLAAARRTPTAPQSRMVPLDEEELEDLGDDFDDEEQARQRRAAEFDADELAKREAAEEEARVAAERRSAFNKSERAKEAAMSEAALVAEAKAHAAYDKAIKRLPHAYAMVQDERGGWYALHLEGVKAEKVTRLEPNGKREHGGFAMSRIVQAVQKRHHKREWGRPKGT